MLDKQLNKIFEFFLRITDARIMDLDYDGYQVGMEHSLELKCGVYGGEKSGASERSRTPDIRFTKPALYQLSYAGTDQSNP
jgi:hypothetical protein